MITFIHIPKTAGTSLRQVFIQNESKIHYLYDREQWKEDVASPSFKKPNVLYGHFEYGFTADAGSNQTYCTFLRHPEKRVISHYKHILRSPGELHRKIASEISSLADFCEYPYARNLQTRLVSGIRDIDEFHKNPQEALEIAKANLESFACFGLTERFDESLLLFAEAFNWFKLPVPQQNTSPEKQSTLQISESDKQAIANSNLYDFELYAFAQSLFEKRMQSVKLLKLKMLILKRGKGLGRLFK